ncbi:hypothetical protein ACRALDRAFT_1045166, partial [Sodiomyces alcalophilus JCM 7366]|uniref:uncharacterized protein n=1 Tax=Sodiomyces alcalophilus JCM 7366 TaxID=591952 RepID=UPI0039B526F2
MAVLAPEDGLSADANVQTTGISCQGRSQRHAPERFEPVAIIGMAMRLPGRVRNETDFWNLLSAKRSGLCDVPRDRFNMDGFYDPSGTAGTIPINKGYFLEDVDIQQFDTTVFPVSKKELERLDPSQRQLLQVAYECFESAGVSSWRGSSTGCYVGEFGEDWADVNAKETQHRGGYRGTGFGDFAMSNRVSYEFDLRGPSMTVKTACSSSLVGLDLACEAIRNGGCDSALVGGTSLMFSPTTWMALNDMGLLSPRGQCRTFDAGADGYARAEAVNMVLIKRLSHALRDNDPIRAIIRGTGVNSDGRTQGMLIPSPVAQASLIRRTYAAAGIQDLSETAIVECHGTGTPVGDPLETEAVANCFGEGGVVITSVKPNVGHSEGAAGLTSLIKNVLALEHRQVLPNINFETPNPKIRFEDRGLHVPTEVEPWPKGRAERVSVNSFGIGGVNAHVIIESPRQFGIASQNNDQSESDTVTIDVPTTPTSGTKTVWVFTGQGAQWPAMGADLLDTNTTFRKTIQKLDEFLQTIPTPPSWKIEHELRKGPDDSQVHRAQLGHPVCVALQIALVDVLRSWGIVPEVIVGHSSGEVAAAYASGGISAEAAMAAAVFRGYSNVSTDDQKGSMAAVGLGRHDVLPYLIPGVVVACENSQSSSTLSGDAEAVDAVIQIIKAERPGVLARLLRVEKAYHSHHMLPYGESYEEQIKPYVSSRDPTTPLHSSVTGKRITGDGCLDAHYWRANMESPVRFNTAFRSAIGDAVLSGSDNVALIEIGPHPALAGPVGQILRDTGRSGQISHVGSLARGQSGHESLMNLAGKLYQQGVSLDYSVLCPPGNFVRDLPRYSWKQDTTHWTESRISREWRFREHPPHELLGSRILEMAANEPTWRKSLALEDVSWLSGHQVNGQVVFPAAGYIAMVGEALEQLLHGATTDESREATYSIKNVRIASARVLEMDKTVELITSLKPIMLDATEATAWYQFTISSFDGTRWARNCFGEARASKDKSSAPPSQAAPRDAPFPRDVDAKSWYNGLRRIGFNYTGLFEGMRGISAATTTTEAKAAVEPSRPSKSRLSRYVLHPATIDQCFQLFTVAAFRGMNRNMGQLSVPTFIEEMVLSPCPTTEQALDVTAHVGNMLERGSFTGNLVAQVAGSGRQQPATICISLKGFKTSALTNSGGDDGQDEEEVPMITQLEWRPHSDFADLGSLFRRRASRVDEWPLLEELILLCMIDHGENITTRGEETAEHLVKFSAWMRLQVERYKLGSNKFAPKELRLEDKTADQRRQRIDEIHAIMSPSPYAVFASAIHKLFSAAPAVFAGDTHPLHVLLEDNVLTGFYEALSVDSGDLIRLLANTNPHMRILEVGAGTGGSTVRALAALTSTYGERLYGSYTYTDVSAGFMTAAKERFANHTAIEYAVLDVTVDPVEQGFQLGTYDLIIAANVLHATPCLKETLGNMRSLLSPGGRLFLEELSPETMLFNYVMGFLSGWWLGAKDNRADQPFISPERWTQELLGAGFAKPEAIVLDDSTPYHVNAGIIVPREGREESAMSRVSLLCHDPDGPYVSEMRDSLHSHAVAVDMYRLGQALHPTDVVISLLDLQEPVLHDMSEETFETVRGYLCSHKAAFVWALPASQVGHVREPRAALALGLARTARNELSLPLLTVEVDEATTSASAAAAAIAKIARRAGSERVGEHESMDPDYEYAVVKGEVLIPRLHWQTMSEAFQSTQPADEDETENSTSCWRLSMKMPGLLHTMTWSKGKSSSPREGEILVETRAVGLNFRDVLIALGLIENSPSEMGFEGSGVVRAVGPGVSQFSVGDRVMYLGSGCFKTFHAMDASLCVKMDDSMSFEQGAALPCVYATALMALVDKAHLQRGQSILIHAACGGVGLAAIQIAQMLGAEIYCTVGSEVKRTHLTTNYGIPPTHIFNSRDASFLPDVLHATDGRGVDVVLNSLSGDLLQASWQCVAEFGTMVEIGKRDFQRRASLAMAPFEANRTFVGLELRFVLRARPRRAAELLERCVGWLREGRIAGPTVSGTFPAGKIQEALRTMQTARHIGKLVVAMPCNGDGDDAQELLGADEQRLAESPAATFQFKSDRTYLLATSSMPLAGIINLSMVLRDVGLRDMTFADWNTAVEPKVRGTWHLHDAVSHNDQLDFFVLFSSCCGIVGQWGQANYAAGNTFLDAFVSFRHRHGLVASVIDLGVMGDVGFVSQNQDVLDNLGRMGMRILREKNLLEALVLTLQRSRAAPGSASSSSSSRSAEGKAAAGNAAYQSPSQVILGLNTTIPISSTLNRVPWRRDPRMSIYHNLDGPDGHGSGANKNQSTSLRTSLEAAMDDAEKTAAIARALASALATFLIKDEDKVPLDRPLELIGMDSLVAMEVRNWIRQQV